MVTKKEKFQKTVEILKATNKITIPRTRRAKEYRKILWGHKQGGSKYLYLEEIDLSECFFEEWKLQGEVHFKNCKLGCENIEFLLKGRNRFTVEGEDLSKLNISKLLIKNNIGLINCNLEWKDFQSRTNKDLSYMNLKNNNLANADFKDWAIHHAKLTNCKLRWDNIKEAKGKNFHGTDLEGNDLTDANFEGFRIREAKLPTLGKEEALSLLKANDYINEEKWYCLNPTT